MIVYATPRGRMVFQHDMPVNVEHEYYYISWVDLPADYHTRTLELRERENTEENRP